MTALLTPPPLAPLPAVTPSPSPPASPLLAPPFRVHRWTNDDFVQLGKAGFFHDQRVMLIDGEFIHMPPPGAPHDMSTGLLDYILKAIFPPPGYWVRIGTGFQTALDTNPMPDLAVVVGSPRDHRQAPRVAVLVVEVSDSTFAYDSGAKANLYAAAGVTDYWVIDVTGRRLLVFRDPVADASAPRGFRYATTLTLGETESVTPLAATTAVRVADLLP